MRNRGAAYPENQPDGSTIFSAAKRGVKEATKMKTLVFATEILSIGTAGAILAACGGNALESAAPIVAPQAATRASSTFTATFSGNYSLIMCDARKQQGGKFSFSGAGSGSFIHSASESGGLVSLIGPGGCEDWIQSGWVKLASSKHPKNSIEFAVEGQWLSGQPPCGIRSPCNFSVVGGTGKFASATGSGKLTFHFGASTYTDDWSGTLSY